MNVHSSYRNWVVAPARFDGRSHARDEGYKDIQLCRRYEGVVQYGIIIVVIKLLVDTASTYQTKEESGRGHLSS